jgi:peptidoglycan/LPS O-acetylase OafA/YrhL
VSDGSISVDARQCESSVAFDIERPRSGRGRPPAFSPDIEGLRAVAIVFVVLYHAGLRYAGGGFLGVDVFFVLSGFLITGIIVDEVAATGTVSLLNFWARRARRILPAATFVTLVVLAANAVVLSPFEQTTRAQSAKAFAVFGSNILFAVRSTDYFSSAATRDPLLHTWSLSVKNSTTCFPRRCCCCSPCSRASRASRASGGA